MAKKILCSGWETKRLSVNKTLASVIIGSGDEEKNLLDFTVQNSLKNVVFLGFKNQTELPKFFAIADIFILPSVNEPWGLVINEAMCASLPIITTKEVGAVKDLVINGFNGITYDAGNINQLSHSIKYLVQNNLARKEMGLNSKKTIELWSYDQCMIGIHDALKNIVR